MILSDRKCWVFGDDQNTDGLHPPRFFSLDAEVVKRGLFAGIDESYQAQITPGDIVVAGSNFGCGSSREVSIRSFLLNGIAAVVAVDFARIFFRSATNLGLPCLTFKNPEDVAHFVQGAKATVNLQTHQLISDRGVAELNPPGAFVKRIWDAGGLLELL